MELTTHATQKRDNSITLEIAEVKNGWFGRFKLIPTGYVAVFDITGNKTKHEWTPSAALGTMLILDKDQNELEHITAEQLGDIFATASIMFKQHATDDDRFIAYQLAQIGLYAETFEELTNLTAQSHWWRR